MHLVLANWRWCVGWHFKCRIFFCRTIIAFRIPRLHCRAYYLANPDATNEVYNIEKWASGFCRISGMIKYTYSLSVNNAYGGLYYTSCSGITMPPYLTDVTYANLQIQHGSGLHGASIYAIASDFSYFSFFLYSATSMTVTPIVHICFEGKWK